MQTKKHKKIDYYPTPELLAQAGVDLAMAIGLHPHASSRHFVVLEPGAGESAPFVAAAFNYQGKHPDVPFFFLTVEQHLETHTKIRRPPLSDAHHFRDNYLKWTPLRSLTPHLIATNPPFSQAQAFIEHSLDIVHPTGLVLMLLRSTFEGSRGRHSFWRDPRYKPFMRAVVVPRPSFTNGGNDSCEYAFYLWAGAALREFMHGLDVTYCDTRWVSSPLEQGWTIRPKRDHHGSEK